MRFGLRASHVKRAALADQILFGLFLPGPDLMLAASLHNVHECGERQFLFEHLDRLSPDDLLLLDRGYVCRWLVAVLNDRAIKFCMRVDNASGFTCVRTFMRSGAIKRLKHRLSLEHVTGLTQQAVAQDVAAKIVCDNLQALVALTAHADADLPETRRVNHAYAHTALKPLLPTLLLGAKIGRKVAALLRNLLDLIAGRTYQHRQNLSKPRNPGQKPHKNMSQKNC